MKKRYRFPKKFNTKREWLWYVRGLIDGKKAADASINQEIKRYTESLEWADFDEKGNIIASTAQPSKSEVILELSELLNTHSKEE
jgi:hypothetical protein